MCAIAMTDAQTRLERATTQLANAETDGFGRHVRDAGLSATRPSLRPTGDPLDLALTGPGTLRVAPRHGSQIDLHHSDAVTEATFHCDAAGFFVDLHGRVLLGADGALRAPAGAQFRPDGVVVADGSVVGRIPLASGTELHSGFRVASSVNSIGQMIEILDAQRSFETAQKTLSAVDAARQKATTDVGHIQ